MENTRLLRLNEASGPWKVLERIAQYISAICCAGLLMLTLLDITLRVFRVEFFLANEFNGPLFAWSIFLAIPIVTGAQRHLRSDFLAGYMSPGVQATVGFLSDMFTLLYMVVLLYVAGGLIYESWVDDVRSQGMLQVPEAYVQLCLAIGLFLATGSQALLFVRRRVP